MGDNVSIVSGNVHQSGVAHPNSSAVVTVMQAVSVGMDLGLSLSPHNGVDPGEENKDFPRVVEGDEDENHGLVVDEKRKEPSMEKSKDGNLVRIVQTTDSSQVIGRDSVIVTVSGSNHNTLWDHQHQQTQQINHNHANVNSHSASTNHSHLQHCGPSDNSNEVQILAHL